MREKPRYPGIRVTANGNQLVSYHTRKHAITTDAGIFLSHSLLPLRAAELAPSRPTRRENVNVPGHNTIAVKPKANTLLRGGAIAHSVCGQRVVNFTSGQGIVYGVEQYYHAPGKCSTMVLEVGARALTKHALNVHCGHDDVVMARWIPAGSFCLARTRSRPPIRR